MGVSVLVYAVFIKSVRKTIFKDKMLGGLFCFIILYFSFYYVVGLYHTGVNRIILGCAVVFVGMSVPALVSGLYAGQNRIESLFFLATEYSSFIFVPFVVAYICAFFEVYNFNNLYKVDTRSFGAYTYLAFARFCLPFIMAHILCFNEGRLFSCSLFFSNVVRIFMISLYVIALVISGARGPVVCVCGAMLLYVVWGRINKKANVYTGMLIVAIVLEFLAGSFFIKNNAMAYRMGHVIDGIRHGVLNTTNESYGREKLWRTAFFEFAETPVVGMGCAGYWQKYDRYPHNQFIEMLCDAGCVGFCLYFMVFSYACILIIKRSEIDYGVFKMGIFFSLFILEFNSVGSCWNEWRVMFIIGYGLAIRIREGLALSSMDCNEEIISLR